MKRPDTSERLFAALYGLALQLCGFGLVIMFLAATIDKQFDVWAPMGYLESLAWSAGLFIVRDLLTSTRSS